MKTLLVADLHFDEGVESEYRWDIFDWIKDVVKKQSVERVVILGDLTERKDRHSSHLVNRLVKELSELRQYLNDNIIILKGNHDYHKSSRQPFFGFLAEMYDVVDYIGCPTQVGRDEYFLPHTKDPHSDWCGLDFRDIKTVYMHQHIQGARFSNDYISEEGCRVGDNIPSHIKIYSGDIHVPQDLGERTTYIGAPYSVDYGDHYDGRCLLVEDGKEDVSLYPEFPKKWSITIQNIEELEAFDLFSGDKVKVKVKITPSEYCTWTEKRDEVLRYLRDKGVEVHCISMETLRVQSRPRLGNKQVMKSKVKSAKDWVELYRVKEDLSEDLIDVALDIL